MAKKLMLGLWLVGVCSLLITANGCKKPATVSKQEKLSDIKIQPHFSGDELPDVTFDMTPAKTESVPAAVQLYDCTYQARGKTAKFRLEFKQTRPMEGEIPVAPGEGRFLALAGSDNSVLLEDLKKALDAQHMPSRSPRIPELGFDAVVLGQNQSRGTSGGFSSKPPGDWILIKLFFPKGRGDKAEMFLNLNPVLGKGEFSLKDSDYGDYLLQEFAKVL